MKLTANGITLSVNEMAGCLMVGHVVSGVSSFVLTLILTLSLSRYNPLPAMS